MPLFVTRSAVFSIVRVRCPADLAGGCGVITGSLDSVRPFFLFWR